MSQSGHILKNLAAYVARFLKCVWLFWEILHETVKSGSISVIMSHMQSIHVHYISSITKLF